MVLLWAQVQQASSSNNCSKSFRDLVLSITFSRTQEPKTSLLERGQEEAQGKATGIDHQGNLNGQQNDATILSEDINQGKNSHIF